MAFEWDGANRLVAISNGTHRTEFHYDGYDRWTHIVEVENGSSVSDRHYLWCGLQLCEERDSTGGAVLKRFSGFGIWSQGAPELPAGSYFFTHDHLGSIREMTDMAGVLRGQFGYSPYGQRQVLSGGLEPGVGFTGYFQHQSSALLLAPFRAYSPQLGRWLSRDPGTEAGGLNLYSYAGNDPLNNVDLTGFGVTPRAAQLAQDLKPVQDLTQGVDAYNKAKDYGKKLDNVMEKGLKKAAEDELEKEGEDAAKDLTKNPTKDYEETLKQAQKTGKEGVDPVSKAAQSVYDPAIDQLHGQNCDTPKEPAPTKRSLQPFNPPQEPSVFDKIIQFLSSPFSGPSESSPADAPTTTKLSPVPHSPPPGAWENGTGY
jgi:RHS repeat-associated protein